jgi:methylenetetrahydrofolate reductase (NADPH)
VSWCVVSCCRISGSRKHIVFFRNYTASKGKSIQELYDNIDPLMEFKPPFDVTTSREEFIYVDKGNGFARLTRMRPGTLGICASITHKYNVDTVPHVLCGGFTKEETEYLLVDCHYLGINNVMALRGDAMKDEQSFVPKWVETAMLSIWSNR